MVDEANIETHGMEPTPSRLARDPDWQQAHLERLQVCGGVLVVVVVAAAVRIRGAFGRARTAEVRIIRSVSTRMRGEW